MRVAGRVSVLIPTYNHEAFIGDAITSALAQTYTDTQIVVADDGSLDGTPDIIRRLASGDSRIVPVLADTNGGISVNVNRALERCSGEYIALLGGDDLMLPEKLERQVAFLKDHPECGICTHDMDIFDSRTGNTLYRLHDRFARKDGGPEVMFTTNWFFGREIKSIPSSHILRASIVGGHRYDERLRIWNEWLHEIDCVTTSGLGWATLPEVLGRYRVHDRQTSRSAEAYNQGLEEIRVVLAIAAVRYPQLARLIKKKREFILFRHLVFDWFAEEKRSAYDRQFRVEAGHLKWLYMRVARAGVRHRWLVDAGRPAREFVRWLLHKA